MTTSKKSTRHISSRLHVYTSTLTQCTFDRPTSHSFHGSNSSNSKDNGFVAFSIIMNTSSLNLVQIRWSNVQYPKLRNKVCLLHCSFIVPRVENKQLRKREIERDFGDIRWTQRNAKNRHNNSRHFSPVHSYPNIPDGAEQHREVGINNRFSSLVERTGRSGKKKKNNSSQLDFIF